MPNYVKLINNFDALKLTTFRANIDSFIDDVNSGKSTLVDALYALTNAEMEFRQERVNRSMVVISHFPFLKTFEDYDFSYQPRLNKTEVMDLKSLRFIENCENVVFLGTPGTGKTHLAVATGIESAKNRYRTYFHQLQRTDTAAQEGKAGKHPCQKAQELHLLQRPDNRRGRVPADRSGGFQPPVPADFDEVREASDHIHHQQELQPLGGSVWRFGYSECNPGSHTASFKDISDRGSIL